MDGWLSAPPLPLVEFPWLAGVSQEVPDLFGGLDVPLSCFNASQWSLHIQWGPTLFPWYYHSDLRYLFLLPTPPTTNVHDLSIPLKQTF